MDIEVCQVAQHDIPEDSDFNVGAMMTPDLIIAIIQFLCHHLFGIVCDRYGNPSAVLFVRDTGKFESHS
jgi:hypothetical protein